MTRQNKQRIIEAKRRHLEQRYPTWTASEIGSFVYYTKTDTTANGLTACIVDYINYTGGQAERINTTGTARVKHRIDPHTGQKLGAAVGVEWTKSGSTPGSADISATIQGRSVKIEVKMKDKQSDAQKRYEQAITRAGGQYWLVHSMDEFFAAYDRFMQTLQPLAL